MLKKVAKAAPWLLLLPLAAVNLSLLRQNRQMRGALANARPAETERLKEEMTMPPFVRTNLAGEAVQISYGPDAPRAVVFYANLPLLPQAICLLERITESGAVQEFRSAWIS